MNRYSFLFKGRIIERLLLLMITIVLAFLFFNLFNVLKKDFFQVNEKLANGSIVNVNQANASNQLRSLLKNGFYYNNPKDIELICSSVEQHVKQTHTIIDNIGELNKNRYSIQIADAEKNGGTNFKKRLRIQRQLLGFANEDSTLYSSEQYNPIRVSSAINLQLGNGLISGTVAAKNNTIVPGVLVRLQMVSSYDSLYNSSEPETTATIFTSKVNGIRKVYKINSGNKKELLSFTAFVRTDQNGKYAFTGLPLFKQYSIIPMQPGFQFRQIKALPTLIKNEEINFLQSVSKIKLFSTKEFNALKKDKALIVRTPTEASTWYVIIVILYFLTFWCMHFFLSSKLKNTDQFILPVIMLLVGFSFVTLFSLQDPLRDRFLAKSTFFFFEGSMLLMVIILIFNIKLFTVDSTLFRLFIFHKNKSAAHGWQWALLAIILLTLTIVFGGGPEGSGVKINLFGFQPSELVKYIVIVFLAGFFSVNERFISQYPTVSKRARFFLFSIMAIVVTVLLFLVLGDLGPAMVCCFTFIVLFSFSRGDFADMVLFVVGYAVSIWLLQNVFLSTAVIVVLMAAYMFFYKKNWSESSIMAVLLMASFLLLDQFTLLHKYIPGPVQRLTDRKAIWQNPWDNEVFGGDQVANGLWAMATGGVTGQGVGEGYAKAIPEAHTDMILPAIGEEFGYVGILCVCILFLLFMHRAIIIARQSGTPFLFYLSAGIGISTFIQFILIAGGSTGALPLSGVALPFISYGGSSLMVNMIAAAIILSASQVKGSNVQMKYISVQQDKNLMPALLAAFTGVILLVVNVSGYFLNNSKWVVEPALVADKSGNRMFSYNPRIYIIMNRLQAGDIVDRNGLLLATSHLNKVKLQQDSLLALGISRQEVSDFDYKRINRYYPFGGQTFFWIGDANTGIFNGSANGYFAEYEHAAELRGFPTPTTKFQTVAHKLKNENYTTGQEIEMTVTKRDYSALAPLLLHGINSQYVTNFKQQNRNVQMTIDAALQLSINNSLSSDDSVKIKRVSVVVLESNTGDVLASSMYPLPNINDYEKLSLSEQELNRMPGWNVNSDIGFTYATQPGSTAKLITALAAFNKLGENAATLTKHIFPKDLIRIKSLEPDEPGNINIERAIVKSNNSFFIRLANEERLEEEMGNLYIKSGMFLHGIGGYFYKYDQNQSQQNKWRDVWRSTEFASIKNYNPDNIKRTRGKGISGMSWGQGELIATPASVARIASAIANNGILQPDRFVMNIGGKQVAPQQGIQLVNDYRSATHLKEYMLLQSAGKADKLKLVVAGKTGTPERIWKGQRINDGWYVFFAPKVMGQGYIVVCIRLEAAKGSSEAVRLAGSYIIPQLVKRGYIKSFEPTTPLIVNDKKNVSDSVVYTIDSL